MKYQYLDTMPTLEAHERAHMPDIYPFDSRNGQIQTSSRISTNRYGKRSDLRKEDDTKSLVLLLPSISFVVLIINPII